jgi:hypothetical protein
MLQAGTYFSAIFSGHVIQLLSWQPFLVPFWGMAAFFCADGGDDATVAE